MNPQSTDKKQSFTLYERFACTTKGISRSKRIALLGIFSFILVAADSYKSPFIMNIKYRLSRNFIPLKHFVNDLIEIPQIASAYIHMKNENTKLKLEIEKLKAKAITISEIEKELKELKKVVNLGDSSDTYKYIEKVQGYDNSIYDSFILISAKQEKTKQGAVVISNEGLVGLVYDSKNSMARVLNLTNQKMFVPGVTDKECHLILRGTGKNELISVEIMDNTISNLEIGDIIYTSGEGGTFSKGIPVAEITEINKDKSEILAKPTVNLDKLSFVWITDPVVTNMKNELPNDLL